MSEWNLYPEHWLRDQRNAAMIGYVDGLEDRGWTVEAGSFNDHPLYGQSEWSNEYSAGYRFYVLVWNCYDSDKKNVHFYKDPDEAQDAFEKARDPLGKHSKKGRGI